MIRYSMRLGVFVDNSGSSGGGGSTSTTANLVNMNPSLAYPSGTTVQQVLSSFAAQSTALISQTAHGFSLSGGVPLLAYQDKDTGLIALADARDPEKLPAFAIIATPSANSLVLQNSGFVTISGGHGFANGAKLFASATPGQISTDPPAISGEYNAEVGDVVDSTRISLSLKLPFEVSETAALAIGDPNANVGAFVIA